MPSPGENSKPKNNTAIKRNNVLIAVSNKEDNILKSTRTIIKKYSILSSRIKIYLPLSFDESLYHPGSMTHADFTFYSVESIRGCASFFDTT